MLSRTGTLDSTVSVAPQRSLPVREGFFVAKSIEETKPGSYSRSDRFQLIRSPSVVLLLDEEEEEPLWSL